MYRTLIGNLRLWRVHNNVSTVGDIHHENILDEVGMKHKSLLAFYKFSVTDEELKDFRKDVI